MSTSFTSYPAYKVLKELAKHPIDLSTPGIITPKRIAEFYGMACGYRFLYANEKVTEEVLQALRNLAKESAAIEKMHEMQQGKIMNYIEGFSSEKRAVLHTATRDFFDEPQQASQAKAAAALASKEIEHLKRFLASIEKSEPFKEIILIGIGGSDLGPRANYYALQYLLKPERKVHFISNVDPDDAAQVIKAADLSTTLVVVVSKSGNTLETRVNEELVRHQYIQQGLDPNPHFIAVTMPGSEMDNRKKYRDVFHVWDWVGGRYSTTSMVGGVILAFAFGFDVYWEFLKGAHEMDQAALKQDIRQNIPLLSALLTIWNRNFLMYPTQGLIPYSQALFSYPAHIQQVEMESNGKRIDQHGVAVDFATAPLIWGEAGTNAQHSFFQLLHQGTDKVPLLIVGFRDSQEKLDIEIEGTTSQQKLLANLWAQSLALAMGQKSDNPNKYFPGDRPTSLLIGKQLTPYALGALLAFFEHKVAFEGFIWGINSFDQEGVQLGKVLATQILNYLKRDEQADQRSYDLSEAFFKQLEML